MNQKTIQVLIVAQAAAGTYLEIQQAGKMGIRAQPGHEFTHNLRAGDVITLTVHPIAGQVQAEPERQPDLAAEPAQAAADAPQEDPTPARRRNRDRQAD